MCKQLQGWHPTHPYPPTHPPTHPPGCVAGEAGSSGSGTRLHWPWVQSRVSHQLCWLNSVCGLRGETRSELRSGRADSTVGHTAGSLCLQGQQPRGTDRQLPPVAALQADLLHRQVGGADQHRDAFKVALVHSPGAPAPLGGVVGGRGALARLLQATLRLLPVSTVARPVHLAPVCPCSPGYIFHYLSPLVEGQRQGLVGAAVPPAAARQRMARLIRRPRGLAGRHAACAQAARARARRPLGRAAPAAAPRSNKVIPQQGQQWAPAGAQAHE